MAEGGTGSDGAGTATMGTDTGGLVDTPANEIGQQLTVGQDEIKGTFESNMDSGTPVSMSQSALDFIASLPDEYKNETFIKEIANKEKPVAELAKMYKNASQKLGQKPTPTAPGDDATPEQKKEWAKALGVPDSIEGYKFEPRQWKEEDKETGDWMEKNRNPELTKAVQEAAIKNNVPVKALDGIVNAFEQTVLKLSKENVAKQQAEFDKYDNEFKNKMTTKFGASTDSVKEIGRGLIARHADDEEKAAFKTFSNEQAVHLASFLKKLNDTYIQQDGFGGRNGATSVGKTQGEIMEIMAAPEYGDLMNKAWDDKRAMVNQFWGTNQGKK